MDVGWIVGFRYRDAIVLLSLHSLSCREGPKPGVVRTTYAIRDLQLGYTS